MLDNLCGISTNDSPLDNYIESGTPKISSSIRLAQEQEQNVVYILKSVVVHHGNAFGGHFTAYRSLADCFWVHIDDDRVKPVNVHDVSSAQAYMLFYERVY